MSIALIRVMKFVSLSIAFVALLSWFLEWPNQYAYSDQSTKYIELVKSGPTNITFFDGSRRGLGQIDFYDSDQLNMIVGRRVDLPNGNKVVLESQHQLSFYDGRGKLIKTQRVDARTKPVLLSNDVVVIGGHEGVDSEPVLFFDFKGNSLAGITDPKATFGHDYILSNGYVKYIWSNGYVKITPTAFQVSRTPFSTQGLAP